MKTLSLLLVTCAAAAAMTVNLSAADALLTPRAKGNEIKVVRVNDTSPSTVVPDVAVNGSPRERDNQIKSVPGSDSGATAANCAGNMAGSPRAVGECASHPGAPMSCCSVAMSK
jgi:hypothetical protein